MRGGINGIQSIRRLLTTVQTLYRNVYLKGAFLKNLVSIVMKVGGFYRIILIGALAGPLHIRCDGI